MSEYRRWISYIYNYDKGIKSTNAGYVRIESRNGKCRMTVNIKGGIAMGERLTMYLFYRKDADMIMIPTGEGDFYNGVCEFSAQTNVDNVFGSGLAIDQISGVVAYSTMDRFYGTEWDDKPILLRRLIEHDTYIEKRKFASVIEINGSHESENDLMEDTLPEDSLPEEVLPENALPEDDLTENAGDEHENESDGWDAENVQQMDSQGEMYDDSVQISTSEIVEEPENVESVEDIESFTNEPMSGMLSRIFNKMPGMYPFEDDDIMECVKFEPQDIGVFPMEKWQLASNSFLLHGYYTYRHLIFARRRTKEGPKCMLGVPGMFRDREKFMAKMFGFDKFKGIRGKRIPGYGEFGYWYMDIDMK